MVHSDWGDWLPTVIAETDPDGVALWYLGCNGFALTDGEHTLFIDPYLGTGDPPRTVRMVPVPFEPTDVAAADAVLATHEHTDHVHGPSQAPLLAGTGADFHAPENSLAVTREENWREEWAVEDSQLNAIEEGDTIDVGDFSIHVEPAHDPDASQPVSYAIEHDAGTFFHGGDARPSDAFERVGETYDIDLGALAFGSVGMIPHRGTDDTDDPARTRWYSDENQVIEAAGQLALDRLMPTHWDMWKGLRADPTALHHHARSLDHPGDLEIVEIGDRVDL